MPVISFNGVDYVAPTMDVQNDSSATSFEALKVPTGQTIESVLNTNLGDIIIVPKKNVSFTFSNNRGSSLTFATVFGSAYNKDKLMFVVGNLYGASAVFTTDSTKSNIVAYCITEALNGTYTASFIGVFSK